MWVPGAQMVVLKRHNFNDLSGQMSVHFKRADLLARYPWFRETFEGCETLEGSNLLFPGK